MSTERISQLSADLFMELESAKRNLREGQEKMIEEINQERMALQTEFEERFRRLQKETGDLKAEKEAMMQIAVRENDVISLNVGGEMFSMKRSTLTGVFPDSYLATLFSGRWEANIERDPNGNYFLDFDPGSFALILTYLRDKRIEKPDRPAPLPVVPSEKGDHFDTLLAYLGLKAHIPTRTSESSFSGRFDRRPRYPESHHQAESQNLGNLVNMNMVQMGNMIKQDNQHQQQGLSPDRRMGEQHEVSQNGFQNKHPARSLQQNQQQQQQQGSQHQPQQIPPQVFAAPAAAAQQKKSTPGWSRRYCHANVQVEEGGVCSITDTHDLGCAAAVRATRGFNKGIHAWEIKIKQCSDYSYIGFVDDTWSNFGNAIGKSIGSWGVASNGIRHEQKFPQPEKLCEFQSGSVLEFLVDMDQRICNLSIDGRKYDAVFRELPAVIYPAVSNCRAVAKYQITF